MRTTLNLDEQLLLAAKHRALDEKRPLSAIIEDALRELLVKERADVTVIQLVTVGGAGVKPGVDLDRSAALREVMDDLP